MKIAIRADASSRIGSGHVMRMLSLAKALKKRGCDVYFLTFNLVENLHHIISSEFILIELTDNKLNTLISILSSEKFDWLIIDHYEISNIDEAYIKKRLPINMLCVDDNFMPHDCDILLNQNIYATQVRYKDLTASSTKLLTGLTYALVREEFQIYKKHPRPHRAPPKLLLTLGGSDPENLLLHILNALRNVETAYVATIICGPLNQHLHYIKSLAAPISHINVIQKTSEMATLMYQHDCAITAAGSSTIESLIMQLPSIVVPIAENQMEVADTLHKKHLAIKAAWTQKSPLGEMSKSISNFLSQGYKELQEPLEKLNIMPFGADLVAEEIMTYKGKNAR